jgi:stage II sporulation protein M
LLKKLRNKTREHISKNHKAYLFLLMAFIIGVSAGAFTVNGLSTVQRDELTNYFHGFLQLLDNQNVESVELFSIAIKDNLKIIALLWALGVTIIGIPFIFIILLVKGFITGFSVGFLISALSGRGLLFAVLSLLPKEIIIVPCLIAIGVNGIKFSLTILRRKTGNDTGKESFKASFASYCLITAFYTCIILAGILADSYITPVIVRIIAPIVGF